LSGEERSNPVSKELAVVPVAAADLRTREALRYAASLAPRVLALCVRDQRSSRMGALEREWRQAATSEPLVIVDAAAADCATAFCQALEVLRRTESLEQITVVLPAQSGATDWWDALQSGSALVVRQTPRATA
jgi:hypothetical protein